LAFVHTADLHRMGEVPRGDLDLYAKGHPPPCIERGSLAYPLLVETWATSLGRPAAEELFRAHYDAVVHHYDADVGEMVAAWARGRADRTASWCSRPRESPRAGNADHGPRTSSISASRS
jgi:hypothetical protein